MQIKDASIGPSDVLVLFQSVQPVIRLVAFWMISVFSLSSSSNWEEVCHLFLSVAQLVRIDYKSQSEKINKLIEKGKQSLIAVYPNFKNLEVKPNQKLQRTSTNLSLTVYFLYFNFFQFFIFFLECDSQKIN